MALDSPLIPYQRDRVSRKILHRRIRELRDEAGMTQAALAAKLGLKDKSTVAQWERGVNSPRAALIPKIAKALNVGVGDLYVEAA